MEAEINSELPEACRKTGNQVGLLNKATSGLVHEGLLQSKTFGMELEAKGFEQSQTDPCVFRVILRGDVVAIIVVYADGQVVSRATRCDDEQVLKDLYSYVLVIDSRKSPYYLRYRTKRNREAGTLKVDQCQYLQEVAEQFVITSTTATPSVAGGNALSKADKPQTSAETDEMRQAPYQEAVGALMWTMNMMQPDISYAGHHLAIFSEHLGLAHWKGVRKASQYVWRTNDKGLTYKGEPGGNTKLSAWVDANYDTRRFVLSGAVMMGKEAIIWFSQIQKPTAAA